MSMPQTDPTYNQTRQAWRDIWSSTEFDRELKALNYERGQEVIKYYLPYLNRDLPVLEAGCGPGHVVYYLQERGYKVFGLDYAPEALQSTVSRFPSLPLQLGDVHYLPYKANTFGAYLSFGVVEHFVQGPLPTLREAYRVLRPSGVLVLTVPHPQLVESLYQLSKRVFRTHYEKLGARAVYYERTYPHLELISCVREAGFTIDLVRPISHSYTFYGLHPVFRRAGGYYETSGLGNLVGRVSRTLLPWPTAFHSLIIARK